MFVKFVLKYIQEWGGGVIPWNGHDGASHFVHYREVSVLSLEMY